jgi:hypothetical protein
MANTLRFKRGLASGIPTALAGEPLFTTDTFDLYIGNGTTNTRFQKYIASGTTSQLLRGDGSLLTMPIVLTSPANGEVLKYNGTNWVNSSDAGITGSGSAGQVAYFTGATTQAGSNNLFWDNTNGRLGIGTNTPSVFLNVVGSGLTTAIFSYSGTDGAINSHNNGTLAITRTAQIRLVNGSTLFGANDRTYQLVNIGRSGTVADFYVQYYDGTSYLDRFRVFGSTGNFGIGTGATDSGQRLQVIGTGYFSDNVQFGGAVSMGTNVFTAGVLRNYSTIPVLALQNPTTGSGASDGFQLSTSGSLAYIWQYENAAMLFGTNATERMRLDASGNLLLGMTTAPSDGAFAIKRTGSSAAAIKFHNASTGDSGTDGLYIGLGGSDGLQGYIFHRENTQLIFATNATESFRIQSNQNVSIGSTADSGERLQVTGTARISGEFRVAAAINSTQATFANTTGRGLAISTAVVGGTNEAAVVLNARSSVTSGTFIFQTDGTQRVQIDSTGLIINGGNALEFINSAANAVSAIRPTGGGTSVMSTNSNGLHIAVGTEAAGDLILASNNTERVRLSSNGWFSHASATNPSSSVTDSYLQYSADVTAGNAAPHFRTENGAVIKLYQETTSVGNSIISLGGGSAVLDDTTFDGYTLRQIVKALRNQGILA